VKTCSSECLCDAPGAAYRTSDFVEPSTGVRHGVAFALLMMPAL
jgi:hypothetical protein